MAHKGVVDLEGISGLPLCLELQECRLVFEGDLPPVLPDVRTIAGARDFLLDLHSQGPEELYYMYRGVHRPQDEVVMEKFGLRFDITVLRPGLVGKEFIRTVGHYHPKKPGTDLTYPEVYEVLFGEAHYLLQKPDEGLQRVLDVILVRARPGEKVVILPNYGHITINPGPGPLAMANWVAADFSSVYGPMKELRGGAYYEVVPGHFLPNPRYSPLPLLREMRPAEMPEFGLYSGRPMYLSGIEDPRRLRFLTHPEEFQNFFPRALTPRTTTDTAL